MYVLVVNVQSQWNLTHCFALTCCLRYVLKGTSGIDIYTYISSSISTD